LKPRINLVTLGVKDLPGARAFYERLGLKASSASNGNAAFFDVNGLVLALFGHAALACGAKPLKTPQRVFWGGYSGYFADPDGHLWEVAHNPCFPLDRNGRIRLP
jgi:hypothetical protein